MAFSIDNILKEVGDISQDKLRKLLQSNSTAVKKRTGNRTSPVLRRLCKHQFPP